MEDAKRNLLKHASTAVSDIHRGPSDIRLSRSDSSPAIYVHPHDEYDYRDTIAYWSAIFFIEGSVLFTIGSISMYPEILGSKEHYANKYLAWVDWPFMMGAWCFLLAHYLTYFQVINQDTHRDAVGVRFVARPRCGDRAHMGCLINLLGCLCYGLNTMAMFGGPDLKKGNLRFDLWYVGTGSLGSFFFAVGAVLEGEYNDWRKLSWNRIGELPVWMSYMNFIGASLFFVAYVIDFNHYADEEPEYWAATFFGVASTFTIGSILFTIASWMMVIMWKQEQFGLGFAKACIGHTQRAVDWKQQIMLGIYLANICMAYCMIGVVAVGDYKGYGIGTFHQLIAYHAILFLAVIVHRTPTTHPYDYLLWLLRSIATFDCIGSIILLHGIATAYSPPAPACAGSL